MTEIVNQGNIIEKLMNTGIQDYKGLIRLVSSHLGNSQDFLLNTSGDTLSQLLSIGSLLPIYSAQDLSEMHIHFMMSGINPSHYKKVGKNKQVFFPSIFYTLGSPNDYMNMYDSTSLTDYPGEAGSEVQLGSRIIQFPIHKVRENEKVSFSDMDHIVVARNDSLIQMSKTGKWQDWIVDVSITAVNALLTHPRSVRSIGEDVFEIDLYPIVEAGVMDLLSSQKLLGEYRPRYNSGNSRRTAGHFALLSEFKQLSNALSNG